MTSAQKYIILKLLQGHSICGNGNGGYRLRDANHNPVANINPRTWWRIRHLLRRERSGLSVIDKRKVRALHGRSWIKKTYKELFTNNKNSNENTAN